MAKKKKNAKVGQLPGTLIYTGTYTSLPSKMWNIVYDSEFYSHSEGLLHEAIRSNSVRWQVIEGIHNVTNVEKIGNSFQIHPLTLEDILHTSHRPKLEDHGPYIFCNIKLPILDKSTPGFSWQQVSIILLNHTLLTFLETPCEFLYLMKERISSATGKVRKKGADYLFYLLIDIFIDQYQLVKDQIDEELSALEEQLDYSNSEAAVLLELQRLKNEILSMRRRVLPLKEMTNALVRCDSDLLEDINDPFFRDLNDHAVQMLDTLISLNDRAKSGGDLIISMNGYRMNQIMKLLTIYTAIFMPLGLIASVYGMNFNEMPLISHPNGFWIVFSIMSVIGILMGLFVWFKKWI